MLPSSTVCRRVSFACKARRGCSGKVREGISRMKTNRNALLDLEGLEDTDLERFRLRYEELARAAREVLRRGELDTGTPELKRE
jgi:hypothetical protein